jgi:hypothetical protein
MQTTSRIAVLLMAASLLATCSSTTGPNEATPSPEQSDIVPGQVIADFSNDVSLAGAQAAISELGLSWIATLSDRLRIATVGVPVGEESEWVTKLKQHPLVDRAQLNHTGIQIR